MKNDRTHTKEEIQAMRDALMRMTGAPERPVLLNSHIQAVFDDLEVSEPTELQRTKVCEAFYSIFGTERVDEVRPCPFERPLKPPENG